MSELFIDVSKTLRSLLVDELQKDVNFLRNYIVREKRGNKGDTLCGEKVRILAHENMGREIEEQEGYYLSMHNSHARIFVLQGDVGVIKYFHIADIQFINPGNILRNLAFCQNPTSPP